MTELRYWRSVSCLSINLQRSQSRPITWKRINRGVTPQSVHGAPFWGLGMTRETRLNPSFGTCPPRILGGWVGTRHVGAELHAQRGPAKESAPNLAGNAARGFMQEVLWESGLEKILKRGSLLVSFRQPLSISFNIFVENTKDTHGAFRRKWLLSFYEVPGAVLRIRETARSE